MYRPSEGLGERIRPALRAAPTVSARKIDASDETDAATPRRAFPVTVTDRCRLKVTKTEHPATGRS
ncbi:hypothetical protein [Streptomyces sp. NPDC001315]|uniref:hypothetical protein n=1 Tax=Streptomyces sp. NPDC001315 TaxID=3364562 RepID=UPI0036BE002F